MSKQRTTVPTGPPALELVDPLVTPASPIEGDRPAPSGSARGSDAAKAPDETGLSDDPSAERSFAEATLVARAQDGDLDAFSRLVQGYETELFRLAYRMLGDRGDAEDVIQDSLVLSWRKLPTLTDPQAFRAWIYHLTTRQCLNVIRARARRRTTLRAAATSNRRPQSPRLARTIEPRIPPLPPRHRPANVASTRYSPPCQPINGPAGC